MNKIFLITLLILFSCCTPPKDNTPIWSLNNRYAIEMDVDCNLTKHSIGLIGCAFKGKLNGHIRVQKFLDGSLTFESSNCNDFTQVTQNNKNNIIKIKNIYTNESEENCSFKIIRKIDNIGKFPFDHIIMGRLFIKIIPDNIYYSKLKLKIRNKIFSGVGWHQRKFGELEPLKLTIYPNGKHGSFRIRCGEKLIKHVQYDTSPFNVYLDAHLESCDFEIVATNDDHPDIEFASLIYEKHSITIDITIPHTYIKSNKRYFKFGDKNEDDDYVVYAVSVNNKLCTKENKCSDTKNRLEYVVRGYTMSGRIFYGKYNSVTNKWIGAQ